MQRWRSGSTILVRDHREIKPGTLRAIIRQADLTMEEFLALLSYNSSIESEFLPLGFSLNPILRCDVCKFFLLFLTAEVDCGHLQKGSL